MRLGLISIVLALLGAALIVVTVFPASGANEAKTTMMSMTYGGKEDMDFARSLWTAMDGYHNWPFRTDYIKPKTHMGEYVRTYYDVLMVAGKPYHVLVKESLGRPGDSLDAIKMDPAKHLVVATVMVQREMGYDPKNNDWFYAGYNPDGSLLVDAKGTAMAGRVDDGTSASCVGCHKKAMGGDFIYTNDPMK